MLKKRRQITVILYYTIIAYMYDKQHGKCNIAHELSINQYLLQKSMTLKCIY